MIHSFSELVIHQSPSILTIGDEDFVLDGTIDDCINEAVVAKANNLDKEVTLNLGIVYITTTKKDAEKEKEK